MFIVILAFVLLAQQTCAYVQLTWPYPLRSSRDPAVIESLKDYDLSSPLRPDRSNFPCKRYQFDDTNPQAYDIKAVYEAGSTYNISLQGGTTYSGGSCQISVSYDNGQSFKVIKSIIGGCPLVPSYNFTIPSFAPSSNTVLLSWSWFNLLGNREMYQNCARVQINGIATQRYRRGPRTYAMKRQSSIDELPDMFACNIGNGCRTVEKRQVAFPQPGPDVMYGQDAVALDPGPGFIIDGVPQSTASASVARSTTSTMSATASTANSHSTTPPFSLTTSTMARSDSASSQIATTATVTPPFPMPNSTQTTGPTLPGSGSYTFSSTTSNALSTNFIATLTTPSTFTTLLTMTSTSGSPISSNTPSSTAPFTFPPLPPISSTTATASTSTFPNPTPSSLPLPCTPGAFTCNSPTTFSQCVSTNNGGGTAYVFFGNVAPGTTCSNGQIVRENAGACTPSGQLFCDGESAFFLCDQGGLVGMGPTAPGTVCRDGVIVAAR